jgi:hypothetical protein
VLVLISESMKADRLNSDLNGAAVYGKTEQKSVTAWLGRRNEAAHGDYEKYSATDVSMLIQQIESLMTRFPA